MSTGLATTRDRARTWLVAAWIVVFANGPIFFIARNFLDLPGTWEGPIMRPAIVLSLGVAVVVVLLDADRVDGRRLRPVPAVPFVAAVLFGIWATVTTFWSLEPEITLWRGIGYALLPLLAWVIADLDPRDWRRALGVATGFIVVTSLFAVVVWPDWAKDFNDDWRGVMTNRNGLGPIAGLGLFAGIALFVDGRKRWGGALVAASGVAMLGTGSRTAMFAFVVAFGVATIAVVGRRLQLARPRRWLPVASFATLALWSAAVVGAIVVLWNEPTFAQRRTIWDLVGDHIADAPLHGTGWAAFWHHPELHTEPLLQRGSAHGAVPELLLGGGVVALMLWTLVVGWAFAGVGRAVWRDADLESWLWLAIVTFLAVENLTESYVLWFSYNWILTIAAALRFGGRRGGPDVRSPRSPARWLESVASERQPVSDRGSQPAAEHSGVPQR